MAASSAGVVQQPQPAVQSAFCLHRARLQGQAQGLEACMLGVLCHTDALQRTRQLSDGAAAQAAAQQLVEFGASKANGFHRL